jgi:hypothetical protein
MDPHNTLTMRDYCAAQMTAMRDYVDSNLRSLQIAVDKSEASQRVREAGQNEWRSAMTDRERNFLTREVFDASLANSARCHDDMNKRISDLEQFRANSEGRMWAIGASVGLVFTLINVAIKFLG